MTTNEANRPAGAAAGSEAAPTPVNPTLASALRMQEVDVRRQLLETQLRQLPTELAVLQRRVDEEKRGFEVKRKALQELEVQRKDLDNRVKLAEGHVQKYKTQQIEVRKNDEYQALTHQIETAEAEVGALETLELEQMLKIDEVRAALQTAERELKLRLGNLDGELALVRRRETQLRADLDGLAGAVEAATADVPPAWQSAYRSAKTRVKRPPYIAPLQDHHCGGCHLRVSNEVSVAARRAGLPVHCDSCGRIVYWSTGS
jgi:predicted  nucleic acid-binding Zn-ribbon protein